MKQARGICRGVESWRAEFLKVVIISAILYNVFMETRNIFENLSCIDHRYSLSEAEVFAGLSKYISE